LQWRTGHTRSTAARRRTKYEKKGESWFERTSVRCRLRAGIYCCPRRLLYVAMTRAQAALVSCAISFCCCSSNLTTSVLLTGFDPCRKPNARWTRTGQDPESFHRRRSKSIPRELCFPMLADDYELTCSLPRSCSFLARLTCPRRTGICLLRCSTVLRYLQRTLERLSKHSRYDLLGSPRMVLDCRSF